MSGLEHRDRVRRTIRCLSRIFLFTAAFSGLWVPHGVTGVSAYAEIVEKVEKIALPSKTDLSVFHYAASKGRLQIIWMPSESGTLDQERALARKLATLGFTVWMPDFHGSYFLPSTRAGLAQIPSADLNALVEQIGARDHLPMLVLSSGQGTRLALQVAQRWAIKYRSDPLKQSQLAGLILVSAPFYMETPTPGFDGELVKGLPKGWRMGTVSDMCEVNKNTLSIKDKISVINYIEISEVNQGIINNITTYSRGTEPSRAKRKLKHGDIAISTVRPDRGSYFLAIEPPESLIASTGFAVFTPLSVPFSFLYCFLTDVQQIEFYGKMADGAAYPAINPSVIMKMELPIPPKETLESFHSVTEKLLIKINENLIAVKTLTQIRDGLLSKLMTGKIELKA